MPTLARGSVHSVTMSVLDCNVVFLPKVDWPHFAILYGHKGWALALAVVSSSSLLYFTLLLQSVVKQEVTGRLKSGHNCPLSVALRSKLDPPAGSSFPHGHEVFQHAQCALRVVVWCYANLSGLMTVREDGMIHSCNSTFSRRLFGLDECDLIEKVRIPDYHGVTGRWSIGTCKGIM